MAINVACACGKTFRVRDEFAGRRGKCPACGMIVAIGAPSGGPAATPKEKGSVAVQDTAPVNRAAAPTAAKPPPSMRGSVAAAPVVPPAAVISSRDGSSPDVPSNAAGVVDDGRSAEPPSDAPDPYDLVQPPAAPADAPADFDLSPAPLAELPVMPVAAPVAPAKPAKKVATVAAAYPGSRPRPKAEGGDGAVGIFFAGLFTPGRIAILLFLILVPSGLLFLKLGPLKARNEWDAASKQGVGDVKDVVTKAMQVYLAQQGAFHPQRSVHAPEATEVVFFDSPVMMRMPDSVGFNGVCTSGRFKGTYFTRTGEVSAEVPVLGATILHVTGRVKNGTEIQAEIDGKRVEMPKLPDLKPDNME